MQIVILEQRGAAALVEWLDANGLHRATIPATEIKLAGETANAAYDILVQGIPYGDAWELLPLGNVGAEIVANELRARGIWTAQDLNKNLAGARAALLASYSQDLQTLLNHARAARG